jgi:hypothetical protein
MTEIRTWSHADPCIWEGEPTTIGAVVKRYSPGPYKGTVARGIAEHGVTNHMELLRYDLSRAARAKRGGQAAARIRGTRLHVSPKGKRL